MVVWEYDKALLARFSDSRVSIDLKSTGNSAKENNIAEPRKKRVNAASHLHAFVGCVCRILHPAWKAFIPIQLHPQCIEEPENKTSTVETWFLAFAPAITDESIYTELYRTVYSSETYRKFLQRKAIASITEFFAEALYLVGNKYHTNIANAKPDKLYTLYAQKRHKRPAPQD